VCEDPAEEQIYGVLEVPLLLLVAAEHAKVCQPGRQHLNHREKVLGGKIYVVNRDRPRLLVTTEGFDDL
jgi:hypothetical protein